MCAVKEAPLGKKAGNLERNQTHIRSVCAEIQQNSEAGGLCLQAAVKEVESQDPRCQPEKPKITMCDSWLDGMATEMEGA